MKFTYRVYCINYKHVKYTFILQAFSFDKYFKKYCLAHLFTYRQFDDGVLGLAYIASDRRAAVGGICSKCKERFFFLCPFSKKLGYIALHISVSPQVGPQTNFVQSIIKRNHSPRIFQLGLVVGHDQQMTPIDFGVSRSKVKITVTFKLRGAYMFHKHFLFTFKNCIDFRM